MERNVENGIWLSALRAQASAQARLGLIGELVEGLAQDCRVAGMPIDAERKQLEESLNSIGVDLNRLGLLLSGQRGARRPGRDLTLDL